MPKQHSPFSIITHTFCAVLFGVGVAYLTWGGVSSVFVGAVNIASGAITKMASVRVLTYESKNSSEEDKISLPTEPAEPQPPLYIEGDKLEIPTEGKFIAADLEAMKITLYQNGKEFAVVPIGTIGRNGAAWETPRGSYKIETKERTHFSSIGEVYMPYSMQFNGNYFIHGWTYYPDGTPVSVEFSGGCIKLKNPDAEKIYNFAEIGTPVYVFSNTENGRGGSKRYLSKKEIASPDISAEAFLIADVNSGEVLMSKNHEEALPVSQISQLMSALVTLDAINFFNETKIKPGQIKEFGSDNLLLPGEKFVIKDLLYPMLFGDNGVAAVSLSNIMGSELFVKKMNARAESIGLSKTVFTDPAGLLEGNRSSATDLFKLTRHLYNFKNYLWGITREKEKKSGRHIWHNHNDLTQLDGFLGGYRSQKIAGVGSAVGLFSIPITSTSSRVVAITILGSSNAKEDLSRLAEYARSGFVFGEVKIPQEVALVTPPLPEVKENSTSTVLSFVGDIMLDRGVKKSAMNNGAGDLNFVFSDLGKIKDSDILFGNLEGPVSDQGRDLKNLYSFRMTPEVVSVLQSQGFDVLSVANNHMADWTASAFVDTLTQFSDSSISLVGGGLSRSETVEPKIIEKNGIKFGYLGFSDVGPNNLKAGTSTAGVLLASDPEAPAIIKRASDKCDVLIVSYHFGNEYEKNSNWRQRELAHMAIDNGARVVVGHHPHVAQETENYRGGVIMYSLGNFIFDQYFSVDTMSGLAVKITFDGINISKIEKLKTVIDKQYRVTVE